MKDFFENCIICARKFSHNAREVEFKIWLPGQPPQKQLQAPRLKQTRQARIDIPVIRYQEAGLIFEYKLIMNFNYEKFKY